MANDTNSIVLIGRIVRDLEITKTKTGTDILNFTLANNGRNDQVSFIDCVAFNKSAELIAQYCGKGSQLSIQGRLQQRSYEKDGGKRYVSEVIVNDFQFLGGKSQSDEVTEISDEPISLDGIPF